MSFSLNKMHQLVYKMVIDQGDPHWITVNYITEYLRLDVEGILDALSDLVENNYLSMREFSGEIEVRLIVG